MARRQVLTDAEHEIEDLARTVECPNCGVPPYRPCLGDIGKQGHRIHMYASHTGRLLAARAEQT